MVDIVIMEEFIEDLNTLLESAGLLEDIEIHLSKSLIDFTSDMTPHVNTFGSIGNIEKYYQYYWSILEIHTYNETPYLTRSLEDFIEDMEPYQNFFDSIDNVEKYYGSMLGRMPRIAAIYIRMVIRKIGYDVITNISNKPEIQLLKTVIGSEHTHLIDMNRICRMLPTDYVLSFNGNFYNTQLNGNFSITDLLMLNSDYSIIFLKRDLILKEILLKFVVPYDRNQYNENKAYFKLHERFLELRLKHDDLMSLYESFVIKEFMLASIYILPEVFQDFYLDYDYSLLTANIRFFLITRQIIINDQNLICEHTFNTVTDMSHIKRIFDTILLVDHPLESNFDFLQKMRLDEDFEIPQNTNTINLDI